MNQNTAAEKQTGYPRSVPTDQTAQKPSFSKSIAEPAGLSEDDPEHGSTAAKEETDRPDKIPWHPGFYGAAELELRANSDVLTFIQEYNLSKEPLRADLLVIRKEPGVQIANEIGRIFKGHNIIEYKSPDDGLTIDDFYKAAAYACLYKSLGQTVDQYPAAEITVSLFREAYPRGLFSTLRSSGRAALQQTATARYGSFPNFHAGHARQHHE